MAYFLVFTNNLETAISAIKQGICAHCIGGAAINGSVSLAVSAVVLIITFALDGEMRKSLRLKLHRG